MSMNMNSKQTVSREEYRRLDNRMTHILQQRWPANEISQWVGLLKSKPQAVACAATLAPRSWLCRPSPPRCPTCFRPSRIVPPCRCSQRMAALLAAAISWRGSPP